MEEYSKAFYELKIIINKFDDGIKNKIPKNIIDIINKSADNNYEFHYNDSLALTDQNLLPETWGLLSILYSNYICSLDEKRKWIQYDEFEKNLRNNKKLKKVEINELFAKNKMDNNIAIEKTNHPIIIEKENIIKRIINKIRNIVGIGGKK